MEATPAQRFNAGYWCRAVAWSALVLASISTSYSLQVMILRTPPSWAAIQEASSLTADGRAHSSAADVQGAGGRPKLVAVGDLHGDLENGLASLVLTGTVDRRGNWIGGESVVVQTGDLMDRGPHSVQLLDLFAKLGAQARAAGGQVITLLGNHEAMNLEGHTAYVHPEEIAEYGPERWREDFAPGGTRGRSLAERPVAIVAGEGPCRSLFAHAGLLPQFVKAGRGLEALGEEVGAALRSGKTRSKLLGASGPLWYRGFAQHKEAKVCPLVRRTLKKVNATRMLIGHTIEDERITTRCRGALVLLDVGISSAYYGRQAAWECDASGKTAALYPGARQELPPLS